MWYRIIGYLSFVKGKLDIFVGDNVLENLFSYNWLQEKVKKSIK